MTSTFGDQTLAEKLSKLNSSQQSIETLSHWCIFHRKRAAQVVQRWAKELQVAPKARKIPFLFLANDILQNSRRKGPEFVNEFWKVLPAAVKDVLQNGEKNAPDVVERLLNIWEERKVFGSREKSLKTSFLGSSAGTDVGSGRRMSRVKEEAPNTAQVAAQKSGEVQLTGPLQKLADSYAAVQERAEGEDLALRKCSALGGDLKGLEEQLPARVAIGGAASLTEELKGKQQVLSTLLGQLEESEKLRAALVSLLREALNTQESKLERLRSQVQSARTQAEKVTALQMRVSQPGGVGVASEARAGQHPGTPAGLKDSVPLGSQGQHPPLPSVPFPPMPREHVADPAARSLPPSFGGVKVPDPPQPGEGREGPPSLGHSPLLTEGARVRNSGEDAGAQARREAAEMAAKLATSASSAAMLSSVLSSLAAQGDLPTGFHALGAMGSGELLQHPPEKRLRTD